MQKIKKLEENTLPEAIYHGEKRFGLKVTVLAIAMLTLGFLFNFPLANNLQEIIASNLKSNRSCPVSFEKLTVNLFLPKVVIKNPTLPGRCFQNSRENLEFKRIDLSLGLPSFFPPALKLHAYVTGQGSSIHAYPLLGFSGLKIRLINSKLGAKTLNPLLGGKLKLQGNFKVDSLIGLAREKSGLKLESGEFKVVSTNLVIPPQQLSGFNLPHLGLTNFEFTGILEENNELDIKKFVIGNPSSPIHGQFKGKINISKTGFAYSKMNLLGELKFSEDFLQDFSLLSLLWDLDNQPKNDGYYKVKLSGPINQFKRPTFLQ